MGADSKSSVLIAHISVQCAHKSVQIFFIMEDTSDAGLEQEIILPKYLDTPTY